MQKMKNLSNKEISDLIEKSFTNLQKNGDISGQTQHYVKKFGTLHPDDLKIRFDL